MKKDVKQIHYGTGDLENIIELYSTFVYNYIYGRGKEPSENITDKQVLYALDNMKFNSKEFSDGKYYVFTPESEEDWDKKYPPK